MDGAWVEQWRNDMRTALGGPMSTFESRFALSAGSGAPVLRLSNGAVLDGAYDAECAEPVAANLQDFLTFLHSEVTEFAGP